MTGRVLVLNRNFQPIHITNAKRAFTLLYLGTAHAMGPDFALLDFSRWSALPIREGEDMVRTLHQQIMIPKIIILQIYDRLPKVQIRLSRANIYARDGYQCQYCGIKADRSSLNLDHVIPRSKHGRTTWENIVCCCIPCNLRKADRSPHEVGMRLIRTPQKPRSHPQFRLIGSFPNAWQPFLEPTIPNSEQV